MTAPDRFATEEITVRVVFGADMMPDRATLLRLVRDQLAGELGDDGLFCCDVIDQDEDEDEEWTEWERYKARAEQLGDEGSDRPAHGGVCPDCGRDVSELAHENNGRAVCAGCCEECDR